MHSEAVSVDTFTHALTHDSHEITPTETHRLGRQANQARPENQRPLKIGSADVVEAAPMVA